MRVYAVEPSVDTGALLAGAQFSDAYSVAIDYASLNARQAAENMMGHQPRWIEALMALRNYLVAADWPEGAVPDSAGIRRQRRNLSGAERIAQPHGRGL